MKYVIEYFISSDIILEYSINKRYSKSISFERYEIKFKTEYSTK